MPDEAVEEAIKDGGASGSRLSLADLRNGHDGSESGREPSSNGPGSNEATEQDSLQDDSAAHDKAIAQLLGGASHS